jgi:hypothetical protein
LSPPSSSPFTFPSLAEALQAAREERERMVEVERAVVRENERIEEAIRHRKNEVNYIEIISTA